MTYYAVSTGEAQHFIPAESHEQSANGDLVIHGREDHSYPDGDWDMVVWADTKTALYDMVGRIKLAPRISG